MRLLLISLVGLVVAIAFVLQGLFTFRTGKRHSFMAEWPPGRKVPATAPGAGSPATLAGRLHGLIFLSAGMVVGCISLSAMAAAPVPVVPSVIHWLLDNLVGLFVTLGCFALGLGLIVRPRGFLEWIGSAYEPPLWSPTDPVVVRFTKLLGFIFIAASLFFLAVWIRNS